MAAGSKKVIYAALVGNTLISISKFAGASITGSSAMLSEAIHSVVDTGNQALLLFGLKQAKKPADENHPFGYGKEIYFWSFIVAILIFAVGAGVSIYEGVHHILHPEPIKDPMINYIILSLAIVFESFAWYMAYKEFQKVKGDLGYFEAVRTGKDPSIFVVLFEDSAALLGLVVAFVGIYLGQITGIVYFDGSASVLIGLILGGTAIWLAKETKGLLIGEGANTHIKKGIKTIVNAHAEVEHVNEILTLHMGPDFILVNLSVDFKNTILADKIEKVVSQITKEIKDKFPIVQRVFIEAEAQKGE